MEVLEHPRNESLSSLQIVITLVRTIHRATTGETNLSNTIYLLRTRNLLHKLLRLELNVKHSLLMRPRDLAADKVVRK